MPVIMSNRERTWVLCWAAVIVGLTCLPYLVAWCLAPTDTQYTGLLINHFDGESYYAKMQQGARGDWLFHLPFTPEPHEGAFVYTFYLALGHLSAALDLPIPLTYHLARVAAGFLLLLVAYYFAACFFSSVRTRRAAFLLLGLSSGFGWLLAPLSTTTADLWVAEGFTYLSLFTNPHFPLTMSVMLLVFLSVSHVPPLASPGREGEIHRRRFPTAQFMGAAGLGLVLAMLQPFAVPIVLVVLAVYLGIQAVRDRCLPRRQILVTGIITAGATPIVLYDLYVFRANPAMAAWSAQNLTPSLPPWNYALGYGLVLLLAIGGIGISLHRRRDSDLFLLSWVGSITVLLYVPFALQRRFITGLHIPLVMLATIGLEQIIWPRIQARRRGLVTGLLVGFTALTNLFVPLVAVGGVAQGRQPLVMTRDEAIACAWLREHTAWTDTVLAPVDSGQFIPAWAGNRVVYGHPFETVDAEKKEVEVARFFSPDATTDERRTLLDRYEVRYVLAFEPDPTLADAGLTPILSHGTITLYEVSTSP